VLILIFGPLEKKVDHHTLFSFKTFNVFRLKADKMQQVGLCAIIRRNLSQLKRR
jgi:hypothetical protein